MDLTNLLSHPGPPGSIGLAVAAGRLRACWGSGGGGAGWPYANWLWTLRGWLDLLVTCDWGPVRWFRNAGGRLEERTRPAGLADRLGWWNGITAADVGNWPGTKGAMPG